MSDAFKHPGPPSVALAKDGAFTPEQKEYLQGFMAGAAASGVFVGHTASGQLTGQATASSSENFAAPPAEDTIFGAPLADLSKPERWKHEENGLDVWEKMVAHAAADKFPDEADTFRFKFHGLFYVAPAQDSFMMRLRIPAGEISAHQLRGLASLAEECGNGRADITTRANLQLRELRPRAIVHALTCVQNLGLTSRGSGADNIRNVTATPTSGFDRDELIDVRPYAHALHHYILNHRDLYGLPRKFNIAFDSGGAISSAVDTNDIGFFAVRITEKSLAALSTVEISNSKSEIQPGIYFRTEVGGITGHKDFARDTGLLLKPSELVPVAAAMVRVFREHGDRTDRKKARLKYLLEKWGGFPRFLEETQKKLAFPLIYAPRAIAEPRRPVIKHGHLGTYKQSQTGLNYVGIGVPVGSMSVKQMRRLADLATHYGRGELRLTVWQSIVIPHVPDAFVATLNRAAQSLGFFTDAHTAAGCVIACTGNQGCKYAAADTKSHARAIMGHLRKRDPGLDQPVNLHLTGCNHSCAQHYCGDIGGIATKLADGREGYHVVLGGGMDHEQGIAREIFRGVGADELPSLVEKVLSTYRDRRSAGESFVQWSRRHSVKEIQEMLSS
ncbi:NirA family protein [Oleiharenicola lentus]|uniref:NirA family protein n=1 Tax=Oleiharenicola lentus TaxID=2508720 RepID=UPI003F677CB4